MHDLFKNFDSCAFLNNVFEIYFNPTPNYEEKKSEYSKQVEQIFNSNIVKNFVHVQYLPNQKFPKEYIILMTSEIEKNFNKNVYFLTNDNKIKFYSYGTEFLEIINSEQTRQFAVSYYDALESFKIWKYWLDLYYKAGNKLFNQGFNANNFWVLKLTGKYFDILFLKIVAIVLLDKIKIKDYSIIYNNDKNFIKLKPYIVKYFECKTNNFPECYFDVKCDLAYVLDVKHFDYVDDCIKKIILDNL